MIAISTDSEVNYEIVRGVSPIAIIEMDYPIYDNSWSSDYGRETWGNFTIDAKQIPDFESVIEVLGENYIFVEPSRSTGDYKAYFDRENNIELRFKYKDKNYMQ